MKKNIVLFGLFMAQISFSQVKIDSTSVEKTPSKFWKKVSFGCGGGAFFGNNFSSFSISPSALYKVNTKAGIGVNTQIGYNNDKGNYSSWIYGGGIFGLYNLLPEIQLSVEVEQLRINTNFEGNFISENNWNTALFIGGGYQTGKVIIGMRYNVLHNTNNLVYNQAFMPFVRVFF